MSTVAVTAAPAADPIDALISSIRIPPRPSMLADVQRELSAPDPSPAAIGKIIAGDVGISGALLKLANSSFYGSKHKAKSVEQAITFLGINQCAALMTGLLARKAIGADNAALAAFWDISALRAQAMVLLSHKLHTGEPDIAHTFGLFCDTGVPLLLERFPGYGATFEAAGQAAEQTFTALEEERHNTSHAAIGCLLTRNWGLSSDVSWAILHHHDYSVLEDNATDDAVRSLVALSVLAESALQKYQGHNRCVEWDKGGARACAHFGLSEDETTDLLDELHDAFHADRA